MTNPSEGDVKDLAGGALVTFVGKFGRLAKSSFVWVVTLLFGTHILGLYEQAWAIVSTVQKVGAFGLHRGVIRYVVEARAAGDKPQVERVLLAALLMGTGLSTVVAVLTVLAIDHVSMPDLSDYNIPELRPALRIMVCAIPFLSLALIFIGATRALRNMRVDVYVTSIAGPLILLIAGSIAGVMHLGIIGLAATQLLMGVGTCVLAAYYFQRYFSLAGCFRRLREHLPWRSLSSFSLPVMLNDFVSSILARLDVLMLPLYVDPSSVGIYAIARRISSAILKLPESFDPMFSSIVSDLSFREQHQQLGDRFVSVARWSIIVSLPFLAAMLLTGRSIIGLFPGADIAQGVAALGVFCVGMSIFSVFALGESLLIMSGRPYLNLINHIVWVLLNFGLNLVVIPHYGIVGAAISTSIVMNLVNGVRVLQVYFIYGIHPLSKSQLKPLLAGLVAFLVSYAVSLVLGSGTVLLAVIAFVPFLLVYVPLLKLLGLEAEDRMLLQLIGRRLRRLMPSRSGRSD